MNGAVDIVKRGTRSPEPFAKNKLEESIYRSCLGARSLEGLATATAHHVCNAVLEWIQNKSEVTADDIRLCAAEALGRLHPEAAYLYKHHQEIM